MKTNIKLQVTPEQSEGVQKICFVNNIGWGNELELNFLDAPCLFIDHRRLSYSHDIKFYNEQEEEEVDADLFIRTNGTCEEYKCEHYGVDNTTGKCIACGENIDKSDFKPSIQSSSSVNLKSECQFTKYGFEKPAFECEILKEYNDHLVGAVYQNEAYFGTSWNKQGTCLQTKGFGYTNMNLTPIKKPWYETCKFPCLIKYKSTYHVIDGTEGFSTSYLDLFIPLTNNEIEELKQ